MTGTNAYGTNLARAHTGALGHDDGSDGTNAPNGSDAARVHAHVGPASNMKRSETPPKAHGANAGHVRTRVGPRLDGNTDTRGLVDDAEREHLQPFGKEVRAMRKAAGLTQEQLGKLAGIGITHISRLEHGRRRPSVDAIKALARVMAPEGTTDAAEQRLARLAGDSLRTGAARRKRQRDNKHRRAALASTVQAHRTMRSTIRAQEARGQIVSGSMRKLADQLGETVERLRSEIAQEPPAIKGVTPKDARPRRLNRPRSRSMKDIRAWLEESRELEEGEDL